MVGLVERGVCRVSCGLQEARLLAPVDSGRHLLPPRTSGRKQTVACHVKSEAMADKGTKETYLEILP